MIYDQIGLSDIEWAHAAAHVGEAEFRSRAIAELERMERAERSLVRAARSASDARRYRERADALKDAAALLAALPAHYADSPILAIARPAANER